MGSLDGGQAVLAVLLIIGALGAYFLPCIIAGIRDKAHGQVGIFLVNLFLGWTVVGWFTALIWASSGATQKEKRREEQRHQELMQLMAAANGREQCRTRI